MKEDDANEQEGEISEQKDCSTEQQDKKSKNKKMTLESLSQVFSIFQVFIVLLALIIAYYEFKTHQSEMKVGGIKHVLSFLEEKETKTISNVFMYYETISMILGMDNLGYDPYDEFAGQPLDKYPSIAQRFLSRIAICVENGICDEQYTQFAFCQDALNYYELEQWNYEIIQNQIESNRNLKRALRKQIKDNKGNPKIYDKELDETIDLRERIKELNGESDELWKKSEDLYGGNHVPMELIKFIKLCKKLDIGSPKVPLSNLFQES